MDHLEDIMSSVCETLRSGYYRAGLPAWQGPRPSFQQAIRATRGVALIAEVKPSSPSEGRLLHGRTPSDLIKLYAQTNIIGISVLTEPEHFGGSLALVREAALLSVPTLMKDFLIAPEQIEAAAAYGASAVLLIATLFARRYPAFTLEGAIVQAHRLGLEVLLEVSSLDEFRWAQQTEADMIGINNRDLATGKIEIQRTVEILQRARKDRVVWSLSGIETAQDVQRVRAAGADAVLVGTALVKAHDPTHKIGELLYGQSQDLWDTV